MIMLTSGYLATCSWDVSIKIWNILQGVCVHTLTGHQVVVTCIIEAKNSLLISGSWDKTIRIWDLNSKDSISSPLKVIKNDKQSTIMYHSLCLIDDNTFAAGSCNDINIYEMNYLPSFYVTLENQFTGHTNWVNSTLFIKERQILISVSYDETCKAWNIKSGECLKTFVGHTEKIFGLIALSETLFVTSSRDGDIMFWDIDSQTPLNKINGKCGCPYALANTQDLRLFVCSDGSDRRVKIYKLSF